MSNYNKCKLVYIHIGKTAGSSMREQLPKNIEVVHMKKPTFKNNHYYVIWIRNPLNRFVSAFWHSANIINFKLSKKCTYSDIFHDKETPFYMLKNKINSKLRYDNPFRCEPSFVNCDAKRYVDLINFFQNPNNLAESLSCENKKTRESAFELMNSGCEHMNKGIGWYLGNGDFVEKHHRNIKLVGRTECMKSDTEKLSKICNKKIQCDNVRIGESDFKKKYLSDVAIHNLLNFYRDSDYKVISVLHKYNFIDDKTRMEYRIYER